MGGQVVEYKNNEQKIVYVDKQKMGIE